MQERIRDARSRGLNIHIWERKEIENYLIVAPAIARFICWKNQCLNFSIISGEIEEAIDTICNKMKHKLALLTAQERKKKDKKAEYITLTLETEAEIEKVWNNRENRIRLIPGKELLKALSASCKQKYNVSFSALQIASVMQAEEIAQEIKDFLAMLHGELSLK